MIDDLFSRADVAAPATPLPPAETAPYANETTSKAAAKSIEPHMGRMAQRVLDSIRSRPKTAREAEEQLGMRAASVTARIRELVLAGKVEDSGEKRDTGSGRKGIVWQVRA